ncbi:MAG: hypothetical protein LBC41_13410, partial [Clostridiales bacterium]|nr:hypothetical protein [Clostridiales bacterium]
MEKERLCPHCGTPVQQQEEYCVVCGHQFKRIARTKRSSGVAMYAVVISGLCIVLLAALLNVAFSKTVSVTGEVVFAPAETEAPTAAPVAMFEPEVDPEDALAINVYQVDSATYPYVNAYFSIQKPNGQMLIDDQISLDLFKVSGSNFDPSATVSRPRQQSASAFIYIDAFSINSEALETARGGIEDFMWELYKQNDKVEVTSQLDKLIPLDASYVNLDSFELHRGFSLYDGLYKTLLEASRVPGPKTFVAIAGGDDEDSQHTLADVIRLAKRTGINVNVIDLSSEHIGRSMQALASETGGLIGSSMYDLPAFHSIWDNAYSVSFKADDVSADGQYTLSYLSEQSILSATVNANTIKPLSVSASSVKIPENKALCGPENAVDSLSDTAWITNMVSGGVMKKFEILYSDVEQMSTLVIQNWFALEDSRSYGRIKTMTLTFEDGSEVIHLADPADDPDYISNNTDYLIQLRKTHYSRFVNITISEI